MMEGKERKETRSESFNVTLSHQPMLPLESHGHSMDSAFTCVKTIFNCIINSQICVFVFSKYSVANFQSLNSNFSYYVHSVFSISKPKALSYS